jgi:hypothetical protein
MFRAGQMEQDGWRRIVGEGWLKQYFWNSMVGEG